VQPQCTPIAVLQSEWSLFSRDIENEVVPTCREFGIGLVPFSPLGRGMLTGRLQSMEAVGAADIRRTFPRFGAAAFGANVAAVKLVEEIANTHGVVAGQVALAWLLAKGNDVVPIPGTKRTTYFEENLGAVDVELSPNEIARLDQIPVVGERTPHPAFIYRTTPPRDSLP
jgi:aryl-alcohol dehydrogenase-like predicted oxidoreductase